MTITILCYVYIYFYLNYEVLNKIKQKNKNVHSTKSINMHAKIERFFKINLV